MAGSGIEQYKVQEYLTRRFVDDDGVLAILHVGSSAIGQSLPSSDLDILIVVDDDSRPKEQFERIGGKEVGIEYFPMVYIEEFLVKAPGSLVHLRFVGRLCSAKILFQKNFCGDRIVSESRAVQPNTNLFFSLRQQARKYLHEAQASSEPEAQVLLTRASAYCSIVRQLISYPPFYNQPKWIIRDLRLRGDTNTLQWVLDLPTVDQC